MEIKKAYKELYELLEANANKKVSTILPELTKLMEAKTMKETVRYAEDGSVEAIFCYYHKEWELVSDVDYGTKKSSKSGLNTMCRVGANAWSKQQRDAKKANDELIAKVTSGEIDASELTSRKEAIEAERTKIVPLGEH